MIFTWRTCLPKNGAIPFGQDKGKYMMLDIIYLISSTRNDDPLFERLKYSLESLEKSTNKDFRINIADTSPESRVEVLRELTKFDFGYLHKPYPLPYSRSYNVNVGVNVFAKSPYFLVLDADVVVHPRLIERCYSLVAQYHCVTFRMYKLHAKIWNSDYDELVKNPNSFIGSGGGFLCRTETFHKLRGFDEEYTGWGAEDSDFYIRVTAFNRGLKRADDVTPFVHLWHEPNATDKQCVDRNHVRYYSRKPKYLSGALNPDAVNPKGYGL